MVFWGVPQYDHCVVGVRVTQPFIQWGDAAQKLKSPGLDFPRFFFCFFFVANAKRFLDLIVRLID